LKVSILLVSNHFWLTRDGLLLDLPHYDVFQPSESRNDHHIINFDQLSFGISCGASRPVRPLKKKNGCRFAAQAAQAAIVSDAMFDANLLAVSSQWDGSRPMISLGSEHPFSSYYKGV